MSTTARLSQLEQVVERLVLAKSTVPVSVLMRAARQWMQGGEPAPIVLHDVSELEAMAREPGIAGRIGRAKLRLARGVSPDGLSPVGASARDGREPGAGGSPSAPSSPTRSTGLPGTSASEVAERIDRLLAAANARG
jgi:hypothetical protein